MLNQKGPPQNKVLRNKIDVKRNLNYRMMIYRSPKSAVTGWQNLWRQMCGAFTKNTLDFLKEKAKFPIKFQNQALPRQEVQAETKSQLSLILNECKQWNSNLKNKTKHDNNYILTSLVCLLATVGQLCQSESHHPETASPTLPLKRCYMLLRVLAY